MVKARLDSMAKHPANPKGQFAIKVKNTGYNFRNTQIKSILWQMCDLGYIIQSFSISASPFFQVKMTSVSTSQTVGRIFKNKEPQVLCIVPRKGGLITHQ